MVNATTHSAPVSEAATRSSRWGSLARNRDRQFWLLQLLGWSGWGVGGALSWAYWDATVSEIWLFGPSAVAGLIVSTGLRYAYRAIWETPPVRRTLAVIALTYLGAGVWQFAKNAINAYATGRVFGTDVGYFDGILVVGFYPMLCWSGLYFGIKYYQLLQEETAKVLRVSAMAHEAQLKMLRYQLNPHFLFNTLNAISTLILESEKRSANLMVNRLSNFLRYSLDSDPMQKVTLAQEVSALKLYLEIEQVRFDDRLRLDFEIEEAAEDALIPSLILQPLVENAIKYAVAPSEQGGTIRLVARVFAQELLLELSDEGPGIDDPDHPRSEGGGVGLTNTRNRLREMYGDDHNFKLENVSPFGLKVCIRIPFEIEGPATP
jgi:signal transduction histidine kinase